MRDIKALCQIREFSKCIFQYSFIISQRLNMQTVLRQIIPVTEGGDSIE